MICLRLSSVFGSPLLSVTSYRDSLRAAGGSCGRATVISLGPRVDGSGHSSFEILQKCLTAGAPVVCAISATSSLAVSVVWQFETTLEGLLRGNRFNVYSGYERIVT
jgi:hypothetical protein